MSANHGEWHRNEASAPLAGIRVLDFTHVLAGPFCTRLLADLGADVVRVESSKHPDHPWPSAFISDDGRHASYLNTNRSKRSIAIDLKNKAGQKLAGELAAVVDVVIENFSAGVMDRLGLGYEGLKLGNPALIYVSMSGYGHNGPRRDWTSMNMNLQGYSGLMMVTGAEGDPPTAISNSWNDYVGGLHACFAILQAIDKRIGSGAGTLIDLSQFECSVAMIGSLLLRSAVDGRIPPRLGNRSERFAPQGVYRCAGTDRWCALSVETDEQWKSLARIIGRESWIDEPRFTRAPGRFRHHDEIDRAITAWTVKQADKDIEQQLKSLGIPAERVRRIDAVVDAPDASRVFDAMSERRVGSMRTTRLPFSLSSVELPPPRNAPSLGEHSAEVLREWLHCSDEEIEELRKGEALQ
jgi:crotonobetainyl-CoA:carnitine CoA-transferase CaiB-like acyl-CoA transferase